MKLDILCTCIPVLLELSVDRLPRGEEDMYFGWHVVDAVSKFSSDRTAASLHFQFQQEIHMVQEARKMVLI